jgi:hypothetical protein
MSDVRSRIARCSCGALTASARGEPSGVYLCACRACQIKSGSAFSYAAVYAAEAVTLDGGHHAFRHTGDSARSIENHFCPTCGVAVFFYSEGFPGAIGIAAGCFADNPDTARDAALTPQRMCGPSASTTGSAARRAWSNGSGSKACAERANQCLRALTR